MTSHEFLEVAGRRVRFRVRGEGPPLLLIQGVGASLELWDPLLAHLDGFQTIVFDHPGAGLSEPPAGPVGMNHYARVGEALLDHLRHERADILGFSFGGMVAQELTRSFTGRVKRLVLVATSCGWGGVPGAPAALSAIATPYRYYSPRYFRLVAPLLYGGTASRDADAVRAQAETRRRFPPSLLGYQLQLLAAWNFSSLPWIGDLQAETLVLCGTDDPITPVANSRLLAGLLPRSTLTEVPGGGHLLLVEMPAVVAPELCAFLLAN